MAKAPLDPADPEQRIRFKISGQTSTQCRLVASRQAGAIYFDELCGTLVLGILSMPWETLLPKEQSFRLALPVALLFALSPLVHQRFHN